MKLERTMVDSMMTIIQWQGIPVNNSAEVAEVLSYHLDQMKRLDRNSIEFLLALEAAKAMDSQVRSIRLRESWENPEYLWVSTIR